jgi:hypothetical protein
MLTCKCTWLWKKGTKHSKRDRHIFGSSSRALHVAEDQSIKTLDLDCFVPSYLYCH